MSWDAVRRWRDRLRDLDAASWMPHLSAPGARLALDVALDALTDEALDTVAAMPGVPFDTAAMACARTVSTAPIEWCAVLLGRGTALTLKHPADDPGLVPALVHAASAEGLPLTGTLDRSALTTAELVVVMGSDDTVERVRTAAGAARVLGFGHRYSVAWVGDPASMAGVALDAALHDGRGCMSPVAVFTPLPRDVASRALADAMADAEARLPRGTLAPADGATIRARRALARALGEVTEGAGWSVHGLPVDRFVPGALPRSLALHADLDEAALRRALAPTSRWLSTIGTDQALDWPGVRSCAPGQMQRPPLVRLHDGVDWLARSLR